jgi:cytochrome c peroxidase
MNTGLSNILGIGVPIVLTGLTVLLLMVHRELGPFSGLKAGGKWLLTGAFGLGILAFAVKLLVAVAVAKMPDQVVKPLVAANTLDSGSAVPAFPATPADLPEHTVWQALPMEAPAPMDNPTTPEKVALGKRLFFDPRLSADGTLSCSSCHALEQHAGADGRSTALGIRAQTGSRNTPTVFNTAFQSVLFWDGRAASLEEQAKGPILNPMEMGMPSGAESARRVRSDLTYREDFARAFGPGTAITLDRIADAIAAYERTLITPDTPYDRFVGGDKKALDAAQLRGMALFESLGCVSCHRGPNFSDASLLGGQAPWRFFPAKPGTSFEKRYDLGADHGAAGPKSERGVWRVPSLRNVALTGPYFHNGSVDTLEEAVRIMATVQLAATVTEGPRPNRALYWSAAERQLSWVEPRTLSDREVADIVAFLKALSSDRLAAKGKMRDGT